MTKAVSLTDKRPLKMSRRKMDNTIGGKKCENFRRQFIGQKYI